MGGMVGATALGDECGVRNLITLDMGGTSADVSLIADGAPMLTNRSRIGPHPLLVPTLDMVTIGAGGGSIAWVEGGFGAARRPAQRGLGARARPATARAARIRRSPTPTSCSAVSTRRTSSAARARSTSRARREAIASRIAEPLGMTLEDAAFGIIAIAEAHMADAIRLVSVERGLDPRDFTLVAFGGAGAAACRAPGRSAVDRQRARAACAGQPVGDGTAVRRRASRSRAHAAAPADARLACRACARSYDELLAEADAALAADGVGPRRRDAARSSADLRYQGQNYELTLPVTDGRPRATASASSSRASTTSTAASTATSSRAARCSSSTCASPRPARRRTRTGRESRKRATARSPVGRRSDAGRVRACASTRRSSASTTSRRRSASPAPAIVEYSRQHAVPAARLERAHRRAAATRISSRATVAATELTAPDAIAQGVRMTRT